MSKDITNQEVMEAVTAVRKSHEDMAAGIITKAEFEAVSTKTDATLKEYDEKNQALTVESKRLEKEAGETKERLDELELTVSKQSIDLGKKDYRETPEFKALDQYLRFGEAKMSDEHADVLAEYDKKTIRTDIDTAGGYRITNEMDNTIIKKITEISPMRSVSRVRTVGKKTLEIVKRNTIPIATYEGEAATGPDDQPSWGNETLTANRLTVTSAYTMDQLMDDDFGLEADLNADISEGMAFKEGYMFVLGDGAKKPEGFLANAEVIAAAYTSAGSGVITFDDLIKVTGELKTGYMPIWTFNRRTLASIRILKDGNGQYAWQPGMEIGPGVPATLLGDEYVLMPDMPDIAASALPVCYGDFRRAYTITDRTGTMMIRDEVTQKRKAIIELTTHRWNHGQVVLAEALVPLKVKA